MITRTIQSAVLLCLCLVADYTSSAPTSSSYSRSLSKKLKQKHTLKFTQRATASRHGDGFKARHKRREYDLQRRRLDKRQSSGTDDDSPLYNLEDAR